MRGVLPAVLWALLVRVADAVFLRREPNASGSVAGAPSAVDGAFQGNESWVATWPVTNYTGPQGSVQGETRDPPRELCRATSAARPGRPGNIVFVKTYKTGSSSWGGVMRRVGCRLGYGGVFENNALRRPAGPHAVFANHISRAELDTRVYGDKPRAPFWVTIVRDPAERCMSWVYYQLSLSSRDSVDRAGLDRHKVAQMRQPYCANFQTEQLRPVGVATPDEVFAAYDFVALTERFDESLVLLKHLWGLSLVDLLYLRSKDPEMGARDCGARTGRTAGRQMCSYTHIPIEEESPAVQAAYAGLTARNAMDQRLYALASAALDRRKARIPGFDAELGQFRAMLARAEDQCRAEFGQRHQCMWGDNGCAQACINRLADQQGW